MPTSTTPSRSLATGGGTARPGGFTLLELLVVLAIASLLLAIAPVAFQRMKESADYRGTIRTMVADLAGARLEATSTGRDVAFSVDLGQRRYGIAGRAAHALPDSLQVRTTVAEPELGPRIARIRFYPEGHATGGSIDVVRGSGAGTRLRTDWLDGRVSLEPLLP